MIQTRGCKEFISLDNFDWRFNYEYKPISTTQNTFKRIEYRGGLPFYQASQCHKLTLKSLGVYENDDWLDSRWNPL